MIQQMRIRSGRRVCCPDQHITANVALFGVHEKRTDLNPESRTNRTCSAELPHDLEGASGSKHPRVRIGMRALMIDVRLRSIRQIAEPKVPAR